MKAPKRIVISTFAVLEQPPGTVDQKAVLQKAVQVLKSSEAQLGPDLGTRQNLAVQASRKAAAKSGKYTFPFYAKPHTIGVRERSGNKSQLVSLTGDRESWPRERLQKLADKCAAMLEAGTSLESVIQFKNAILQHS